MSDAEMALWLEGRWMEKSKRPEKLQEDLRKWHRLVRPNFVGRGIE